jgi:hypothetical protein
MSSSSSNNVGNDAWLLQIELERELMGDVTKEEGSGDSLEVQAPESEQGTLASISTKPNPCGAMKTARIHTRYKVLEGSI